MNDKKNLDRLFQEKFKDFEVEPNEQVWRNIESALNKKKKKRVVPIWYRLSGVAAALILGAFVFYSVWDSNEGATETGIVIEDNSPRSIEKNDGVATESNAKSSLDKDRTSVEDASNPNLKLPVSTEKNSSNAATNTVVSSDKKSTGNSGSTLQKNENIQNAVATKSDKATTKSAKNRILVTDSKNAIAQKTKKMQKKSAVADPSRKNQATGFETGIAGSETAKQSASEKANAAEMIFKNEKSSVADNQTGQKNNITNSTGTSPATASKTDATATVEIKNLDSTAIATVEPNALEELLKENEKEKNVIAETKLNRWQITPQIAPIYFGSASEGSPIDQQFAGNNKTYDKNLSYGVAVNYAVSKKLNVRTGINKLTLGYNTNGVNFVAGLTGRNFESIGTSENAAGIQIISSDISSSLLPFESSIQSIKTGSISQTMGYVEVPMELSYKLIDNKFGINIIGGVSTLFLDENTISISSKDVSASLGKANNLNDVHFSSNFGVGFKYSFWKSFEFNFEPTLKYQINTFSKNSGDFKPYFLGLYSGVSFRF